MRICCIADLDGRIPPDVPTCDLLLVAGDLGPDYFAGPFLQGPFTEWLVRQPATEIVGIAGNHDFIALRYPQLLRELPWTYLEDETAEVGGVKIAGSPWTPWFGRWAFMTDERELERMRARVPEDTEIVLSHGPPHGYADQTVAGVHAGSTSLTRRLDELPELKLVCCGHIHEAYGTAALPGGALVVNASLLNERYELVNAPVVVEL